MTVRVEARRPQPLVSVLMPCFNAGRFLNEALESILGQTFSDFELIAVDDGSTDETLSILQAFAAIDARVRIVALPENVGNGEARNRARSVISADLIAMMDADDISYPDRLEKQVSFLTRHEDIAVVGCWIRKVNSEGLPIGTLQFSEWDEISRSPFTTGEFGGTPVSNGASIIRRSALDEVGWYRPAFRAAEDVDLWRRMLDRRFRMTNLQEVLLDYRWHGGNTSIVSDHFQAAAGLRAAFSQRLRIAGLDDPFERMAEPPIGGVVNDWEDFPLELRRPYETKWVRQLARHLDAWSLSQLTEGLLSAVRSHGWSQELGEAVWLAALANLRSGNVGSFSKIFWISLGNNSGWTISKVAQTAREFFGRRVYFPWCRQR